MIRHSPSTVTHAAVAASVLLLAFTGFVPDASAQVPSVPADSEKSPGAVRDPGSYIDSLLQQAWDEAGVSPSAVAPDHEFVRRAYLDVLGRTPTVEEAGTFLASKDPARRSKLITTVLEHPDYPKNFATVWRVALIGRRNRDREVNPAALETWLRRQFLENRPWNEIASDLVTASGNNRDNGATNFTLAHMEDQAVNLTSYTTRLFLGQQIQCTQCHDHPENDWKQADFWGINAFFKGVRRRPVTRTDATGAEVVDAFELFDEPTGAYSTYEGRNAMIGIAFPTFLDGRKISQGTDVDRRTALANFITEPDNSQFSKAFVNRMWGHFMGRGFVQPVDDFGDHNPPSHPELLDKLATDFRASGYDVKALIRWITASKAYQITSATTKANAKDETLFSHMQLKPMSPEQLFDSLLVATSAHKAGGDADTDRRRQQWLGQFVFAFANDEENEGNGFQGTIPQALMMMNGELIARATGTQRGSFLAKVVERASAQPGRPDAYAINLLHMAALSRLPTSAEMSRYSRLFNASPDRLQVVQDIFWALLNSNEFILNH